MKSIALTKGMFAKVDDGDFEFLSQWRWRAEQRHGREFYAVRYKHAPGNRRKRVSMARLLMGEPKGFLVDHWNGDTLDNQRGNLRKATNAQNQCNQRRLRINNTSGFKGVYLDKARGKYVAQIYQSHKRKNLGYFGTAEEAALAYDAAAVEMFGDFAAPNAVML
jgi:hypothetical protein